VEGRDVVYYRHLLSAVFVNYFHENQTVYSHNTRNRTNLHLYGVNSMFGKKCIKFKGQHCGMTFQHQLKVLRLSINLNKFLKIICQVSIINNVLHKCYVCVIH